MQGYIVFSGSGNALKAAVNDEPEYPEWDIRSGIAMQTRAVDFDKDETDIDPIPIEVPDTDGLLSQRFDTSLSLSDDVDRVFLTVTDTETDEVVFEGGVSAAEAGFSARPPPPDPDTIRNDIEADIIDAAGGMTLYRVGTPRISDTWQSSFTAGRGSGGLGTGVYAYASEAGAREDTSAVANPDRRDRIPQPVIVLKGALSDPLILSSHGGGADICFEVNYCSQFLSMLASNPEDIESYRREVDTADPPRGVYEDLRRDNLNEVARSFESWTAGQREGTFLPNTTRGWERHLLDACEEANRQGGSTGRWVQPINIALRGAFDGVYPVPENGGDLNRWGAVVFKQVVDECVGRVTTNNEEVDPDVLNVCFAGR